MLYICFISVFVAVVQISSSTFIINKMKHQLVLVLAVWLEQIVCVKLSLIYLKIKLSKKKKKHVQCND